MKKSSLPKWNAVLDRWVKHSVPLVEIRRFDRSKHLPGVPWMDKSADKNLNSYYAVSNPQWVMARHLAEGIVTNSPEIFAAFAIHSFGIDEGMPYRIGLEDVSRQTLAKLDPRPGPFWTANSKRLFLHPGKWHWSYSEREVATWIEWVDSAARFWTLLASEYSVIRIPDFMDFQSEEYRAWQSYAEEQHRDRERREYQRLKAKFADEA